MTPSRSIGITCEVVLNQHAHGTFLEHSRHHGLRDRSTCRSLIIWEIETRYHVLQKC